MLYSHFCWSCSGQAANNTLLPPTDFRTWVSRVDLQTSFITHGMRWFIFVATVGFWILQYSLDTYVHTFKWKKSIFDIYTRNLVQKCQQIQIHITVRNTSFQGEMQSQKSTFNVCCQISPIR